MTFAAWKGVDGRVKHGHDDERSGRLSQLEPLAGQQLPIAVLLLPDLQCTDLDTNGLAVGLHFSFEQRAMAALPTTAMLSSGKVSDLTIALLVMTPSTNSAFV